MYVFRRTGLEALRGHLAPMGAIYASSWMRTSENTHSTTFVNKGKKKRKGRSYQEPRPSAYATDVAVRGALSTGSRLVAGGCRWDCS
jgi:hypothetical protein